MFSEITQIITIYLANSVVSCTYSYPCIEKKKKQRNAENSLECNTHWSLVCCFVTFIAEYKYTCKTKRG